MRVILVDDEKPLLDELESLLTAHVGIQVTGVYTDPLKALEELPESRPECAFLDIEMAGMNGIELAEKLIEQNGEVEVLFVTAYNHYATQAFEVNAIDYLLKPIRPERLAKALEKLLKRLPTAQTQESGEPLRISSFGNFEISAGGKVIKWSRSKARELFAYFLQNEGRWISKYKICDDLWQEFGPDQATANLQTALWALKKALRDVGCQGITIEYAQDKYILHIGHAIWDKKRLDGLIKSFLSGNQEVYRECLALSKGGYLQDEDWPWADPERERYVRVLMRMKTSIK